MALSEDIKEQFLQFQEAHWLGLWAPALVELPFGKVAPLFPGDDLTWLYRCDLGGPWTHEEIVRGVEKTAEHYFCPPGFYFTNGWRGDIEAFKAYIAENGYSYSHHLNCFYLANTQKAEAVDRDGLIVEECDNPKIFISLNQKARDLHPVLKQRLQYRMERPINGTDERFYVARNVQSGEPMGIFAIARDKLGYNMAYLHKIAVLPDYRGQGLSRALCAHALHLMRDADYVFSVAASHNERSLRMHEALGFKKFDQWDIWARLS